MRPTASKTNLHITIGLAVASLLLMPSGWATAAEPARIASCEWRVFDTGNAGAHPQMVAVRIADTQGHDGVCVMSYDLDHFSEKIQSDPTLREKAAALSKALVGQDASTPQAIKAIWEQMDAQKPGFDLETAIDLALWDLYGRANGKPVVDLLGKKREKVATYHSTFWPPLPPFDKCKNHQEVVAAYVELARDARKRGMRGFKIHPYCNGFWSPITGHVPQAGEDRAFPDLDVEIARAVRAELGDSMPMMLDSHWTYTKLEDAIRVGKVLDELKFLWNEDPLPEYVYAGSEDREMKEWIALKKATKTSIMGPENFLDYKARIRWFEGGATDWLRIDVCYGGFTPCLEMIRYCEQHKIKIDLHSVPLHLYQLACYAITDDATMPWIETLGLPKYLPIATTFPGSEPASKNSPWYKRIPKEPVDAEGYAHINLDIPGLGPEADWDWIAAHGKDPFQSK